MVHFRTRKTVLRVGGSETQPCSSVTGPVSLPGEFMDRGAWQATESVGSQRVGHDWATNTHIETKIKLNTEALQFEVPVVCILTCTHSVFIHMKLLK